jgi:hypothetical protein
MHVASTRNSSGSLSGSPPGNYSTTAANAFDLAVKRRVLASDWIVRITRQVLLRGHLIGLQLAVAKRCVRQLFVRLRRWRWCGWISRTSRLRKRHRSVDQSQQRYRRDQPSHDGSPELGPLSGFMVAGNRPLRRPYLPTRVIIAPSTTSPHRHRRTTAANYGQETVTSCAQVHINRGVGGAKPQEPIAVVRPLFVTADGDRNARVPF